MTHEIVQQSTQMLALLKTGFMINIIEINGVKINEKAPFGFGVPWKRFVEGPPIRIGRKDTTGPTPVHPEIDMTSFWAVGQSPVSRIQAALEWKDGKPQLRTMSSVSKTWTRRTGSRQMRVLPYHQYWELRDGDVITFGMPKGHRIVLRIRFHGSPQS